MDAKDLMIGDWVKFTSKYGYGTGQVVGIEPMEGSAEPTTFTIWKKDKEGNTKFFVGVSKNYVKPTPLTAEILEKNGFEFGHTASEEEFCSAIGCSYPEEKGWCYDEGAGEIKIIFPSESDGGLIRLDDQCIDKHLEVIFVKPIMVHELQHCLKLVGIEKEIQL